MDFKVNKKYICTKNLYFYDSLIFKKDESYKVLKIKNNAIYMKCENFQFYLLNRPWENFFVEKTFRKEKMNRIVE